MNRLEKLNEIYWKAIHLLDYCYVEEDFDIYLSIVEPVYKESEPITESEYKKAIEKILQQCADRIKDIGV